MTGKVAERPRRSLSRSPGRLDGDEMLGSPEVAGKWLFSVKGQLQGGPWVATGEPGFLSDQRKWAGARQTWVQVSTSPFTRGVSESVAHSLLSLTFAFSQ